MILFRQILICLLLIAATAALLQLCFVLQDARSGLQASVKAVQGFDLMRLTLQSQITGKYGLLSELTSAARESRKTIDVLQKTSLAERAKVAAFSDASIQAVNDLDTVARNAAVTVESLRATVDNLGRLSTALEGDAASIRPVVERAGVLLGTLNDGSGQVLQQAAVAVSDVDARVRAIKPVQQNLLSVSRHVDGAAANLEQGLGYIRDSLKPANKSFWVRMLDQISGGVFSLWLKWVPQRVSVVQ